MDTSATIAPAHPAATVIVLRDAGEQLETLLLRRNSKLAFHGGAWVFPGGRVDAEDFPAHAPEDTDAAASRAAVREAQEEAGLTVSANDLVWISHWTTPTTVPMRFATWFYMVAATEDDVQVDGGEIHDHRWMRPDTALAAQRAGEIELPAPTYVSLLKLQAYGSASDALADHGNRSPEIYTPRLHIVPGGRCSLYAEDAGYETGDLNRAGSRHRLWMIDSGWRYERGF